jgi:hypothetical protein
VRLHEPDGYECRSAGAGSGLGRTYADVRSGGDFEPVTGSTPRQRQVLLEQVKAHVTTELASLTAGARAWAKERAGGSPYFVRRAQGWPGLVIRPFMW